MARSGQRRSADYCGTKAVMKLTPEKKGEEEEKKIGHVWTTAVYEVLVRSCIGQ